LMAPAMCQASCKEKWISGKTFLQCLQFYVEQVHPTPSRIFLLVLDNHELCNRKQHFVPLICITYDAQNAAIRYCCVWTFKTKFWMSSLRFP
jgi:hypothetical protein